MAPSIQRFAAELLTQLGADVMEDGADRLAVSLPSELAARFDHREAVDFAFSPEAVAEGREAELLIPGSYWLGRLLEIAEDRGQTAAIRLAPHPSEGRFRTEAPEGLIFPNASPEVRSVKIVDRPYLLVYFKVTFLSDDIEEDLLPVWVGLGSGKVTLGSAGFPWAAVAQGSDLAPSLSGNGERFGLDSALNLARAAAEAEATHRSEQKDREIEQRLQDEFVRLDGFYARLLGDLGEREKRAVRSGLDDLPGIRAEGRRLKEENQRRKQEALDKFQLKVVVRPINAARVAAPEAVQELEVSDGSSVGTISVVVDLVRGTVREPRCSGCGEPMKEIHLCRRGHLTCSGCAETCFHCRHVFCTPCGILPCPNCGHKTCPDCAAECEACEKVMCKAHLLICADTGRRVCPRCATDCPVCRRRYSTTPLRRCPVGAEKVCPACLAQCPICDRLVCSDHRFECASCGQSVCHSDRASCPGCLQQYCGECLPPEDRCPTCRNLFPVRQSHDAIVSVLTGAGVDVARMSHWHLAEDRHHFLVTGRRWWWRHLFVLDRTTLGIVARRRWFRWFKSH